MSPAGPLWKALVLAHERRYKDAVLFVGRIISEFPREHHLRTDESKLLG